MEINDRVRPTAARAKTWGWNNNTLVGRIEQVGPVWGGRNYPNVPGAFVRWENGAMGWNALKDLEEVN